MKVFGIGLNKTGTKTLGECFRILGYKNKSYDYELLTYYHSGDFEKIFSVADQFDSFEDWPWPLMYREFDQRYPGSKFILTLRKTPEIWLNSLIKHSHRTGPTNARKIVYGYEMPEQNPQRHLSIYRDHHLNVVNYFKSAQSKLLIVNWEEEASWKPICEFLQQKTIPAIPFPHKNKSTE